MGKVKKEKSSKTSHEKKSKSEVPKKRKNGEKKKTSVEEGARKYGYISANSVITMAEAAGFSGIPEEVAKNLAEDVTYRLRYVIQQCKKYMTHIRRKRLCCSDINEVLKMCDVPSIYGHTTDVPLHNFTYIREADVYVLDDNYIDLPSYALTEIMVHQKPSLTVTGAWLKTEEIRVKPEVKVRNEDSKSIIEPNTSETFKNVNTSSGLHENQKLETSESESKIPTNLIKYYGITCNTILGHSDLKMVFQDLSKNHKILPIIPYLLTFLAYTLNNIGREREIKRLLQSVEALSKNLSIDFSPYVATSRVINAMLLIVASDKKPSKICYDYKLRTYTAHVLSRILSRWCTRDEQRVSVVKKMGKLICDHKVSMKVHYGAIVLLTALGPEALNISFWEFLSRYLIYLEELKKNLDRKSLADVAMLEEIILSAAVLLYRFPHLQEKDDRPSLSYLDQCLYLHFGEAMCSIRLNLLENPRFLHHMYKNTLIDFEQEVQIKKTSRTLKYMSTRYKPAANRLTVENVFNLPKVRKKRNSRIMFKFAGSIPVPEVNLRRRRLDSRYSQFIAGKESEGHVVVVGKFRRKSLAKPYTKALIPVGSIFSIL